jgi:hypothetical protein
MDRKRYLYFLSSTRRVGINIFLGIGASYITRTEYKVSNLGRIEKKYDVFLSLNPYGLLNIFLKYEG